MNKIAPSQTELRRDPLMNRWVIVKTEGYLCPEDYEKERVSLQDSRMSPFTYNREHMTPPEVDAFRPDGSAQNQPGWTVRVVPNKFPALRIEGNLDPDRYGIYEVSNGIGAHEVLVETPDPIKQMADYTDQEICDVIHMYQRRYNDLTGDKRFKYILIFKNYGRGAGASVDHAHSQIIALPMIPISVQGELNGALKYYHQHSKSIYEDILVQEYVDKERIVAENDDFIVFCPYVPRYAFETWILPKDHQSRFRTLSNTSKRNLALLLRETLKRLKKCLANPAYNFYLQLHPVNSPLEESFLWHIEIVPKLTQFAEFDRDCGFYVVQTPPKVCAEYLRKVDIANS